MSAKHKQHRPGKGTAVTNPDVRIGVCSHCARYGLLSKHTGRCTGETVHDVKPWPRVIDRVKRCAASAEYVAPRAAV